jgi:hypothetical protein
MSYLLNQKKRYFNFTFYSQDFKISDPYNLKSKNEVLNFSYKNIALGELIYDTYLPFRSKPTIKLEDAF